MATQRNSTAFLKASCYNRRFQWCEKQNSMEKLFTNSVHFQDLRHTQVRTRSRVRCPLLSSPLDKTPERQVLGHRMISTRSHRPGEEHALSWMERTAGGEGNRNYRAGLSARNLNFTNLWSDLTILLSPICSIFTLSGAVPPACLNCSEYRLL